MKNLTWQNTEQLFVAQVLINKVKSKCCGIKDSLRNFTDNVKGKWGDDIEYIRDINDGENTQKGLNILVAIGFSVDINDNKYRRTEYGKV